MVKASDENSESCEIFFESIYLCKIKLRFLIPIFTVFDDFVVVVVVAVVAAAVAVVVVVVCFLLFDFVFVVGWIFVVVLI